MVAQEGGMGKSRMNREDRGEKRKTKADDSE